MPIGCRMCTAAGDGGGWGASHTRQWRWLPKSMPTGFVQLQVLLAARVRHVEMPCFCKLSLSLKSSTSDGAVTDSLALKAHTDLANPVAKSKACVGSGGPVLGDTFFCRHTNTHTQVHAHAYTHAQQSTHTYIHTRSIQHTHIQTRSTQHTHIHTLSTQHTHIHTRSTQHTHTHTLHTAHTHIHTLSTQHTHTYTNAQYSTHIHIHTRSIQHTHIHTHTLNTAHTHTRSTQHTYTHTLNTHTHTPHSPLRVLHVVWYKTRFLPIQHHPPPPPSPPSSATPKIQNPSSHPPMSTPDTLLAHSPLSIPSSLFLFTQHHLVSRR